MLPLGPPAQAARPRRERWPPEPIRAYHLRHKDDENLIAVLFAFFPAVAETDLANTPPGALLPREVEGVAELDSMVSDTAAA